MPERSRLVVDTNVLVSRLLSRNSVAAQAVRRGMAECQLIVSRDTQAEVAAVLARPKFDLYLSLEDRLRFLHWLGRAAVLIEGIQAVAACRDPRDDKFLALAVAGHASVILSGDHDLLALHPFRGVSILSPRQYLDWQPDSWSDQA